MSEIQIQIHNIDDIEQILNDAYLGIRFDESLVSNPLAEIPDFCANRPELYITALLANPNYLSFTCKEILGVNILPMQSVILKELFTRRFPMLIGSRGLSKSFTLALYVLLKLLLQKDRKIILCGSSFRQSKIVFNYMEKIISESSILKSLIPSDAITHGTDNYQLVVGSSYCRAIPVGPGGDKIRGQRATETICDEFGSMLIDVFETVIAGFGSVSASPQENVKQKAKQRLAKKLGYDLDEQDLKLGNSDNQIIIAGTAYYDFNHFSQYHKRWLQIIKSRGDINKLRDIFGDKYDKGLDWRDYCVIRIPYELIPEGFMDSAQVIRAKATITASNYAMEYGACTNAEAIVTTDCGAKKICDIIVGDKVLTHRGRFKPVVEIHKNLYNGPAFKWETFGYNNTTITTVEHPFWDSDESWIMFDELKDNTKLVNLKELNGRTEIDITQIIQKEWMECEDDTIYPVHSQCKFAREELKDIRNRSLIESQSSIARYYGTSQATIHNIVKKRGKPKNAIPKIIPLNFDMGMIVGYYASEGSIGADKKACVFSLDGHVNEKLQTYISQLSIAINNVFDINSKYYISPEDNVCNVTVNAVFFAALMSKICPGTCLNKYVLPKILFSNKDFLAGFITGYWNGDGHNPSDRYKCSSSSSSLDLTSQVRTCLSYFNISSSLSFKEPEIAIFREKEYLTSGSWHLHLHGENTRIFRNTFYPGQFHINEASGRSQIINQDGMSLFAIKTCEKVHFNDFVYNITVEDDHSFCLPTATTHNCFVTDSDGFFKTSLLNQCTVNFDKPITLPSGRKLDEEEYFFEPELSGHPLKEYIYGIDPASRRDNFSVVILEDCGEYRKVVHVWVTNEKDHKAKLKVKLSDEHNFYAYVARKIRQLMTEFPCKRIALDTQGGGIAVLESLKDRDKLKPGESPILPIKIFGKPQDTDYMEGLHIVEPIAFASDAWTSEANHGLKKDFEDNVVLFPYIDGVSIVLADIEDEETKMISEGINQCIYNIEELKRELATIIVTETATGREHFDTPEIKTGTGRKGRMHKDRYSALLMANWSARNMASQNLPALTFTSGGFSSAKPASSQDEKDDSYYSGPENIVKQLNDLYSSY